MEKREIDRIIRDIHMLDSGNISTIIYNELRRPEEISIENIDLDKWYIEREDE